MEPAPRSLQILIPYYRTRSTQRKLLDLTRKSPTAFLASFSTTLQSERIYSAVSGMNLELCWFGISESPPILKLLTIRLVIEDMLFV